MAIYKAKLWKIVRVEVEVEAFTIEEAEIKAMAAVKPEAPFDKVELMDIRNVSGGTRDEGTGLDRLTDMMRFGK